MNSPLSQPMISKTTQQQLDRISRNLEKSPPKVEDPGFVLIKAALMIHDRSKQKAIDYLKEQIQLYIVQPNRKVDPRLYYFLYDLHQMDFNQKEFEALHSAFTRNCLLSPPDFMGVEDFERHMDSVHLLNQALVMPEYLSILDQGEFNRDVRKVMIRNNPDPIYIDFSQMKGASRKAILDMKLVLDTLPINRKRIICKNMREPIYHLLWHLDVFQEVSYELIKR